MYGSAWQRATIAFVEKYNACCFENRVSKDNNSFYYLAVKDNKICPKANWKLLSDAGSRLMIPKSIPTGQILKWSKF